VLGDLAARTPDLRTFVAELVLDPPSSSGDLAGPPHLDDDWLVLSTIHSAKGLEWQSVHLIAAYDGNFPACMSAGSGEEIDEERRLFYVGLTRARRELAIYVPRLFGACQRGTSSAVAQPEDRVAGRDAPQLVIGRIRANALEEDTDLELPPLQVGAQQWRLLVVDELGRREGLAPAAEEQRSLATRRSEVPHPLRLAAGRYEEAGALERQQVHGRPPGLAARPPAHLEDARAEDADTESRRGRNEPVEHVRGEPAGVQVSVGHDRHDGRRDVVSDP
jgi:ATP-dependent exoDNAse (exonuclease V) beta subunit